MRIELPIYVATGVMELGVLKKDIKPVAITPALQYAETDFE